MQGVLFENPIEVVPEFQLARLSPRMELPQNLVFDFGHIVLHLSFERKGQLDVD